MYSVNILKKKKVGGYQDVEGSRFLSLSPVDKGFIR